MSVCGSAGDGLKQGRQRARRGRRQPQQPAAPPVSPHGRLHGCLAELGHSPGDPSAEEEVAVGDQLSGLDRRSRRAARWGFAPCFFFSPSLVPWHVLSTDNSPVEEPLEFSGCFLLPVSRALPLSVRTG